MSKPIVTVGVCVRNCAFTIREAVKSIMAQDYSHELMEIVVVDGHSKDETLSIIKDCLSNSSIKTKFFYENSGLGFARQMVVDNAEGKYIVWVDGDMVLSPDYITKLVKFMNEHPEVGIAKGKQSLEFTSNLLGILEGYSRAIGKMVDFSSEKAYSKALGTSGAIYRTEAVRQIGGFDKSIRGYGEDWDIELRVRDAGWSLNLVNAKFLDYERCGLTWKNLWSRYWRRGYDTHYFLHKNKSRRLVKHYRMFPLAAFLLGIFHANRLFKLTCRRIVFLLPLQYLFKMTAWYVGFIRSHFNRYEPKS